MPGAICCCLKHIQQNQWAQSHLFMKCYVCKISYLVIELNQERRIILEMVIELYLTLITPTFGQSCILIMLIDMKAKIGCTDNIIMHAILYGKYGSTVVLPNIHVLKKVNLQSK